MAYVFISSQPKKQRLNYGWLSSCSSAFPDVSPPMLRTRGGRNRNVAAAASGNGKQASEIVSTKGFSSFITFRPQFTQNRKFSQPRIKQSFQGFIDNYSMEFNGDL